MKLAHICAAFAIACASLLSIGALDAPAAAQTVSDAAQFDAAAAFGNPASYQSDDVRPFQPDGSVSLPWGDLLSEILTGLIILVGTLVAWALRKAPKALVDALDMFAGMMGQGRANELLEKAVTYGINTTAGAVKGKTLDFKVSSAVLERAYEYAIRNAPGLVKSMGGLLRLREKIIARLEVSDDVALPASQLDIEPPPPPPATP